MLRPAAHDHDAGMDRLEIARDSADETAAADRDENGIERGTLAPELDADGPLPGNDIAIIVGRDVHASALLRDLARIHFRLVAVGMVELESDRGIKAERLQLSGRYDGREIDRAPRA